MEVEYEKPSDDKTVDDFITLITIRLNLARLYSKLDFKDIKKKVSYLASSLKLYENTYKSIKDCPYTPENQSLREQLKICEEMIGLLPVKISKINRGEEI